MSIPKGIESIVAVSALIVVALLPQAVTAQGLSLSLAPQGSRVWWSKDIGLPDANLFGGAAKLGFGRYVALEAGYGMVGGLATDFAGAGFTGPGGAPVAENTIDANILSSSIQLRLGSRRLAPLLVGSGGVLTLEPRGRETVKQVFAGYGGGLDFRVTPWLDGRALVQDLRFRTDRGLLTAGDGAGAPADDQSGKLRSNLTASLSFGARLRSARSSTRADAVDQDMGRLLQGGTEGLMVPVELQVGKIRFDRALGISDQSTVGASAGVDLGPYFGLRGSYWRGVSSSFDAFRGVTGWAGEAQFNVGRVTGARPYLLLGFGQMLFAADFRNDLDVTPADQSALILGAGFGYPLSDRARLTVTIRDHVTTSTTLSETASPKDLRHSIGLGAGLSFLIRGARSRPAGAPGVVLPAEAPATEAPATEAPGAAAPGVEAPGQAPAPGAAQAQPAAPPTAGTGVPATAAAAAPVATPTEAGPVGASPAAPGATGYQSDRVILLPLPTMGELYVRYGPNERPAALAAPQLERPAPATISVPSAAGAEPSAALTDSAVAAVVRRELQRAGSAPAAVPSAAPAASLAGSAPVTQADLAALEARIFQRLAESQGAPAAETRPTEPSEALVALERQVAELAQIVHDATLLQVQSARNQVAPVTVVPGVPVTVTSPGQAVEAPTPGAGSLSLGGAEVRVGTSTAEDSRIGMGVSGGVWLRWPGWARLRPFVDVELARTPVSSTLLGSSVLGTVHTYGGSLGARLDLPSPGLVEPSLSVALRGVGGSVSGDSPQDQELMDLRYKGFHVGPSVGVFVARRRAPSDPYLLVAGARRFWAGSRSGWSIEAGVRLPRGGGTRPSVAATESTPASTPEPGMVAAPAEPRAGGVADTVGIGEARDSAAVVTRELRERIQNLEEALQRESEARERAAASADSVAREVEAAAAEARTRRQESESRLALRRELESFVGVLPDVISVRASERGLAVVMGGGMFRSGSAALPPSAATEMERLARTFQSSPEWPLVVEGHTDSTGGVETNLVLSQARAEAVRAALVSAGVAADRISAIGVGEGVPIANNDTAEGRARNRRVEIVLIGFRAGTN